MISSKLSFSFFFFFRIQIYIDSQRLPKRLLDGFLWIFRLGASFALCTWSALRSDNVPTIAAIVSTVLNSSQLHEYGSVRTVWPFVVELFLVCVVATRVTLSSVLRNLSKP